MLVEQQKNYRRKFTALRFVYRDGVCPCQLIKLIGKVFHQFESVIKDVEFSVIRIGVGNDSEITIAQLAERVKQLAESTSKITFIPYDQAYGEGFDDMMRRVPELTRIKKLIGYQPQCDLDRIILDVIADQRQNAHRS